MIKILATILNFEDSANIGADVEKTSVVIEVPSNNVPKKLKEHLENKEVEKWQTLALAILEESY